MIEINGIVKLYLNNKEILEEHNTWTTWGFYRVQNLLLGAGDGLSGAAGTIRHITGSNSEGYFGYLDSNFVKTVTANVLKAEGETFCSTGFTLSTLDLSGGITDATLIFWSTLPISPPLTIPSGWTLRVEWSNTFTGTDYSATYLNRICNQLNASTVNSTFPPYSISIVHSTGETYSPISETIGSSDVGKSIAIYKGSFITGALTNIGTIRTYRDVQYSSSAISLFNKPADVELHIEHRNTITQ